MPGVVKLSSDEGLADEQESYSKVLWGVCKLDGAYA